MQQLSSKNRLSISDFTFDKYTCTISFYSTKTNKCWSRVFSENFIIYTINYIKDVKLTQKDLITLKKLCKNGNN